MIPDNFLCTRPLLVFWVFSFLFLFFFAGEGGGVEDWPYIMCCIYLGGWGVGGSGLLDIKHFLYINIYLLRNFYTPNYYMFGFFIIIILLEGCRWIGGLYIKYLFYVNGYSLGSFNTPNYYLLVFFGGVGGLGGFRGVGGNTGNIGHNTVTSVKLDHSAR